VRGSLIRVLILVVLTALLAEPAFAQKKRRRKKGKRAVPAKVQKKPAPEEATPPSPKKGQDDTRALRRGERIEFDARLIQGQTAKAGAVYLFERASTNLRSMVKDRTSFRDKIIRMVFPKEEDGP
jgi:hypothetical protein